MLCSACFVDLIVHALLLGFGIVASFHQFRDHNNIDYLIYNGAAISLDVVSPSNSVFRTV